MKRLIILIMFGILTTSTQAQSAMLDQIAALKAYIVTAEKGYQIAEDGLHTIRDIKSGEFTLHSTHYASLSTVNPVVKNVVKQPEAILVTDGKLQMTDGERIRLIIALNQLQWKLKK